MCAAVCHSIARLRPNTTNPDFEASFIRLEELGGTLQDELAKLKELWEKKGETLDRILQFRTFENDAEQVINPLSYYNHLFTYSICYG